LAATAAAAASSFERPEVVSPSDMSTIRAGGGACPGLDGTVLMASREAKMASPIAVRGPSWRLAIACFSSE
jgi:hypothetical protein